MKRITIELPDELADLFTTRFILDRCEAGASLHTLMVKYPSPEVVQIRHSRLGVMIQTESIS